MIKTTAEKITLLNKVTLDSLGEHNKLAIIKNITEASIKIMGADFGFAWWKPKLDDEYQLVYKSKNIPYEPNPPRKRGGNYIARKSGAPVFVLDTAKEKYSKQYDVSPYMKSYIIIPIIYSENFYGNVVLCFKKQKKVTKEDKTLAQALGNALAQSLTISRLYHNLTDIQKTLDSALDSIFIFDPDSLKIHYANKGAVLFSGHDKEQLLNRSLDQIITGLTRNELLGKMQEIKESPDQYHIMFESTFAHHSKGKIPVEVYLQHVAQENKNEQYLAMVRDITDRKQSEQSITKMAYFDQLTGIANRAQLMEKLRQVHDKTKEANGMYAVFFMDLDRFKIINDIYGHQVGDMLLKQVAQRLSKAVPKKGLVARMGGDEFIALLPDLESVSEAEKVAAEILNSFTEYFQINEHELYSNASIGFSIFPLDGIDYHVVMKHADLALHRSKEHGGGNIQQYHAGQPLFYTMQPKLQSQLRKAIKRNELVLQYQPIVNVKTKKIIGSEALVRWNHPEMGLLYPGDFVGQAEESGLIIEIGEWVINEVCRQIRQWEDEDRIPPPVSINVSPRELLRPTLVKTIEDCLKEHKVSPSQIKLELTETFLMKNIDLSISILEQLKALGLRILIDDFGTGYASLNYLRRLPIDSVKIDRSFVSGVPNSLQDAALTSAIIAISHQLGLEVVAEGVETIDQFDFLRAAQCNYAQGNFFFKPVYAQQFVDLLRLAHPS